MDQGVFINNRYQLIAKLGQGGMGAVYKAYDRLEKQHVALKKVLVPEKQLDFASKAGTNDSEKLRLSLAREFSILATLRHPHILSVLDFGFDEDKHPFYTMTLLEGVQDVKTCATGISRGRRIHLLGQILQALHYLHRRGVLHRDLKPDNVFVTPDEQIKVMDFGLAKLDNVQSNQSDILVGTIAYMAPEQFQGKSASVASDLFAVGVMVYEIMVGRHPFEAKTIGEWIMNIMTQTPDLSAIPDDLAPWLEKALDKDPARRFPTAYDALVEFYKFLGREVPAEDRAIRESFLHASTFVGRESEFKQLTDALDNISSENAFFLIGGESGAGKSRLLDEFRIQSLVKGATVLHGQATEGGGLPFQVWRNVVRRLLLMVDVTDLQAGVLKALVSDMSELLGRDIPDAPELTGKAYQDRIVLTIVDLLREVQQPMILLLEDLQWAVESLEPLKQLLLVKEQHHQLMIVANYRTDEAPELPDTLAGMTTIKLERLDDRAVQLLMTSMLGGRGGRDAVVQMIQQQSEGNTFFIIETVRALAEEQGSLEKVSTATLPPAVLTSSMQELMKRRLRKVDARYSEIQKLASVIGRELDLKLLHHRFDESRVQAWLTDASNAAVLVVQGNTWRFSHDKLRETVIADIPDDDLPTIHRTAAEAIEAVYPDHSAYHEVLMGHWRDAGDDERELHYLVSVVETLVQLRAAYVQAETLIERGLLLLGPNDVRSAALLNWRSESHLRQGNCPAAQSDARQSYALAERLGAYAEVARSLNNLGDVFYYQDEYAAARDYFQQSLALRRQLGDRSGIATSLYDLGYVAFQEGEYAAARDYLQRSLALRRQLGDQRGIANSLHSVGNVALDQGEYAAARDYYEQSLVLRRQLGDQRGIADSLSGMGKVAFAQGEYATARDYLQQSLALYRQIGDQYGIAYSLSDLGLVAVGEGEVAAAHDYYEQSLALSRQLGDQHGIATSLNNLGYAAYRLGEYAAARDYLQQSLALKRHIGQRRTIASSLNTLAGVALEVGTDDLLPLLREGLTLSLDSNTTPTTLELLAVVARRAAQQQLSTRAGRLAGLVAAHPATNSDVRVQLDKLRRELEALLPAEELAALMAEGTALDLATTVQELLAEFAPPNED